MLSEVLSVQYWKHTSFVLFYLNKVSSLHRDFLKKKNEKKIEDKIRSG